MVRIAVARTVVLLMVVLIVAIGAASTVYLEMTQGGKTASDTISLPNGVSICSGACGGHQSPYLSATVFVNSNSPLVNYQLFINGTDEGVITFQTGPIGINQTTKQSAAYLFQAYPSNGSMPVQAGKTYFVKLVAHFDDGETSIATAMTTATSTLATTSQSGQVIVKTSVSTSK